MRSIAFTRLNLVGDDPLGGFAEFFDAGGFGDIEHLVEGGFSHELGGILDISAVGTLIPQNTPIDAGYGTVDFGFHFDDCDRTNTTLNIVHAGFENRQARPREGWASKYRSDRDGGRG